eukprot:TRINITY_DN3649_c0_g1_i1.p1 TRINITY_DN3649_c0_g1~~TRINITY_DN3649_c0_g1_i1.p1  ORF type:complete len:1214 (-),score=244.75 TRINITY_DN3649_c0_g1_i1:69-3710(-)
MEQPHDSIGQQPMPQSQQMPLSQMSTQPQMPQSQQRTQVNTMPLASIGGPLDMGMGLGGMSTMGMGLPLGGMGIPMSAMGMQMPQFTGGPGLSVVTPMPINMGMMPPSQIPPGMQLQQPKFEPGVAPPMGMMGMAGDLAQSPLKPASSLVVNWLLENYEAEEGSSLPRSTLYTHYLQFCQQTSLESVNAASFGKLIRSVFPNLKTRRLGTRGHSKYHYYGIRLRATSKLRNILDTSQGRKDEEDEEEETPLSPGSLHLSTGTTTTTSSQLMGHDAMHNPLTQSAPPVSQAPTPRVSKQLPEFGVPDRNKLPPSVRWDHVQTFALMYRTHCQHLLDTAAWHNFPEIENLLSHFWQGLPAHFKNLLVLDGLTDFLVERDTLVYQSIAEILVPDVLGPMPLSLTPLIRDFSRNFPEWLARAVDTLPATLIQRKVAVATEFSDVLRKQATLNAMAASCRKVLGNVQHVTQMLHDWSRIDFHAIAHQSHWLCPAAHNISNSIQEDFRQFLQQRYGVEQWAVWLADVLNRFLVKCTDVRQLALTSQQVLLKWSFYSSLVIRDLTLRNAPSLGSFHLLRTLFESYLAYLVDLRMQAHKTRMPYIPDHAPAPAPHTPMPAFQTSHIQPSELALSASGASNPGQVSEADKAELAAVVPHPPPSGGISSIPTETVAEGVVIKTEEGVNNSNNGNNHESPLRRGNKHFLVFPPADSERPFKQARIDPDSASSAESSGGGMTDSKVAAHTAPPPSSSFSFAQDRLPSLSGLLPPSGFVAPKALPQSQGSFLLTPTEWAGVMPMGSGGSMNFGSMGSMSLPMGMIPGMNGPGMGPSAQRKPSFGSFGSFSTEFRCLMRSTSFDRIRGSFERREGSTSVGSGGSGGGNSGGGSGGVSGGGGAGSGTGGGGSVPPGADSDSHWQHLFYNMSTPNISFQSFGFSQDDTTKDTSASSQQSASTTSTSTSTNPTSSTAATNGIASDSHNSKNDSNTGTTTSDGTNSTTASTSPSHSSTPSETALTPPPPLVSTPAFVSTPPPLVSTPALVSTPPPTPTPTLSASETAPVQPTTPVPTTQPSEPQPARPSEAAAAFPTNKTTTQRPQSPSPVPKPTTPAPTTSTTAPESAPASTTPAVPTEATQTTTRSSSGEQRESAPASKPATETNIPASTPSSSSTSSAPASSSASSSPSSSSAPVLSSTSASASASASSESLAAAPRPAVREAASSAQ